MAPNSDGRGDIIHTSLLQTTAATDALTSSHLSLLDRKHYASNNINQVQHKVHTKAKTYIYIVHASSNIYTYTDQFIRQVQ
jgi:hypothetical protein